MQMFPVRQLFKHFYFLSGLLFKSNNVQRYFDEISIACKPYANIAVKTYAVMKYVSK